MSLPSQMRGTPFSATATGGASTVATQSAVAGRTFYVTDIAGSSDLIGATLQVKDGTTVIWQITFPAAGSFQQTFTQPLRCTVGNLTSTTVTATTVANANIGGYYI